MAAQFRQFFALKALLFSALSSLFLQTTWGEELYQTKHLHPLDKEIVKSLHLSNNPSQAYSPVLKPETFLFGEEFEYWIDLPIQSEEPLDPNSLITVWEKHLRAKLDRLGFPPESYSIKTIYQDDFIDVLLHITIGNWESKVFIDTWDEVGYLGPKSYHLLEVHASPYRLDQTFTIEGDDYSVYDLIDWFITDIASELGLRFSSGHKHLDIQESFGNNIELFFRQLVDVENKAWLPEVFGCQQDSGMDIKSFVYVTQLPWKTRPARKLHRHVSAYNKLIALGYNPKHSNYPDNYHSFRNFWSTFTAHLYFDSNVDSINLIDFPANLRLGLLGKVGSNEKAKSGKIVETPTSGTMELRFLPTAQSGAEARLINQMLTQWIRWNFIQQGMRLPIKYTPYDPLQGKPPAELLELYDNFISELGLKPEEYRTLYRQGCQSRPEKTLIDFGIDEEAQD